MLTYAREARRNIVEIDVGGTRDTLQRYVIEIATTERGHLLQTRLRRCGREEKYRIETARIEELDGAARLFRWIVDDENTIRTGATGFIGEALRSHGFDRVRVTEQHDRCATVGLAEGGNGVDHRLQRHAMLERPLARTLDHG